MGKKFVGLDGLKHFWTQAKIWIAGRITGEVTAKIAEVVANAPEDLDTLKEIADWISTHADSASEMNTQITENKNNIATNTSDIAALQTSVSGKADTEHTHTKSEITDFPTSLPADGGNANKIEPNYTSVALTTVTSDTIKYIKVADCIWSDVGTLQVLLRGNYLQDTLVINFGGGDATTPMLCGYYSGNSNNVYSVIVQKGSRYDSDYSIYVKVSQVTTCSVNVALLKGNCTIDISETTTAPTNISEWPTKYGFFGTLTGSASKVDNSLTFGSKTYNGSSAQTITASDIVDLDAYQKKELTTAIEGANTVEGALGALSSGKVSTDLVPADASASNKLVTKYTPRSEYDINNSSANDTWYKVGRYTGGNRSSRLDLISDRVDGQTFESSIRISGRGKDANYVSWIGEDGCENSVNAVQVDSSYNLYIKLKSYSAVRIIAYGNFESFDYEALQSSPSGSNIPLQKLVTESDLTAPTAITLATYTNSQYYTIVEIKAVRIGLNTIQVAGILTINSQCETLTFASGLPVPKVCTLTTNSTQMHANCYRGTSSGANERVLIDKNGNMTVYTNSSGQNLYFSCEYTCV